MERKRFSILGISSIVYAIFFTFCLYKNSSGITAPFFVVGTLYYLYYCMKKLGVLIKKDAWFYMISTSLLGVSMCLTDDTKIIIMNYMGIFILFISFMLHHFYEDSNWSFERYFEGIVRSVLGTISCSGNFFSDFKQENKERKQQHINLNNKKIGYIVTGIFITIPLLFIIIILLSSADAIFAELTNNIFNNLFGKITIPTNLIGIVIMLFLSMVLPYGLLSFMSKKKINSQLINKRTGEPITAMIFTSALAVTYLVFSIIQILFLFTDSLSLPQGYSYANYAREGFFQLLFVCVINLVLVLLCLSRFKESKYLKVILTIISMCTYIMIASSAMRMLLYINYYYLTFLRLFVLWSLAVIFIIMTGIIIYIYKDRFPLFKFSMITVTIAYLFLSFSHPDYFIAKYNITFSSRENINEREYLDTYYLSELSSDAAPVIVDYLEDLDEQDKDGALSTENNYVIENLHHYLNKIEEKTSTIGIRNYNVSRWIAKEYVNNYF